jgi:hypothetical protein
MNKGIFGQARARLSASSKKANSVKFARSLEESKEVWSEYLTEHQRCLNRLGNAMETVEERGWFERLTAERRNDPLLKYIEQARHADEHGRQEIAEMSPGGLGIGVGGGSVFIEQLEIRGGKLVQLRGWQGRPGSPIKVEALTARLELKPVVNRGMTFVVPTEHLGQALKGLTPALAAELGVQFLERKISECEQGFGK